MVNLLDLYYRGIYGVLSCFHFLLRFLEYSGFMDCVLDMFNSIGTCIQPNSTSLSQDVREEKRNHLFYSYLCIYIILHASYHIRVITPHSNATMRYMQSSFRTQSKANKSFYLFFPSILRIRYPIRPLTRTPPTPTINTPIIPRRIRRRIPI